MFVVWIVLMMAITLTQAAYSFWSLSAAPGSNQHHCARDLDDCLWPVALLSNSATDARVEPGWKHAPSSPFRPIASNSGAQMTGGMIFLWFTKEWYFWMRYDIACWWSPMSSQLCAPVLQCHELRSPIEPHKTIDRRVSCHGRAAFTLVA